MPIASQRVTPLKPPEVRAGQMPYGSTFPLRVPNLDRDFAESLPVVLNFQHIDSDRRSRRDSRDVDFCRCGKTESRHDGAHRDGFSEEDN